MLTAIALPPAYADEIRTAARSAEISAYAFWLADIHPGGAAIVVDRHGVIEAIILPDELAPAIEPALWLAAAFGNDGPLAEYLETPAGKHSRSGFIRAARVAALKAPTSGLRISHSDRGVMIIQSA